MKRPIAETSEAWFEVWNKSEQQAIERVIEILEEYERAVLPKGNIIEVWGHAIEHIKKHFDVKE